MVLIAVAVLLGLWGVYALTQTGEDTTASGGGTTETAEAEPQGGAAPSEGAAPAGENGAGGNGADDTDADARGGAEGEDRDAAAGADRDNRDSRDAAAGADRDGANRDGADRAGADRDGGASAGAGAPAASEPKINVLNNSFEQGIAQDVYNDLREKGHEMGESGNLPDSQVVVAETTVFFTEGDAAGEEAARKLADHIHRTNGLPAVAKPNDPNMPDEYTGDGTINLVLTGGINV